jgi:purine-binding chemotaxis protein CheW
MLTRVPKTPGFVEGVTSVRGQIIPVVSLRRRFQLEPQPPDLRTRLIVIRLEERRIAMLVDSAREFTRIASESIQPPPASLTGPGVEYLEGVAPLGSRLVLVINLHRLFDEKEKEALAKPISMEE